MGALEVPVQDNAVAFRHQLVDGERAVRERCAERDRSYCSTTVKVGNLLSTSTGVTDAPESAAGRALSSRARRRVATQQPLNLVEPCSCRCALLACSSACSTTPQCDVKLGNFVPELFSSPLQPSGLHRPKPRPGGLASPAAFPTHSVSVVGCFSPRLAAIMAGASRGIRKSRDSVVHD